MIYATRPILIVGERYGSLCPDEGISYTEKEFNYAQSKGIPTLCFVSGHNYATTQDARENDPKKQEQLKKFRGKLLDTLLCDQWSTEDELTGQISSALYKTFAESPGVGWIRGDAADPDTLTKLVSLYEENKKLKERVRDLEAEKMRRAPILSLMINEHDINDGPLILHVLESNSNISFTPHLQRADIPSTLSRYIDDTEITQYNNALPTQDDINSFNEKNNLFLLAFQNKPTFSVGNSGTMKASDIRINIHLPDGLQAIESEELKSTKPEISIPENPIEKVKKNSLASRFPNLPPSIGKFSISPNHSKILSIDNIFLGKNGATISNNQEILIKLESARQDSTKDVESDLFIIPRRRGEFKVKVRCCIIMT